MRRAGRAEEAGSGGGAKGNVPAAAGPMDISDRDQRGGPLAGRRVVVTRTPEQSGELAKALAAAGAEVLPLPTIAIEPPADRAPLEEAVREAAADRYDGYIFTSQNGVGAFFAAAETLGRKLPKPAGWVCAIGPATARALAERGWEADIVPGAFVAESVAAALEGRVVAERRILLPLAAAARRVIPEALAARGARVEVVEAYRTVAPAGAEARARELFPAEAGRKRPDAVLLTSSSTARHLAAMLGDEYRQRLRGVLLAAIGPVTAATLAALGLTAGLVAEEFTARGLVTALARHYSPR
ncbi:MAG: uroporphyrinogen-III synthase [Terriglobales bacterium]